MTKHQKDKITPESGVSNQAITDAIRKAEYSNVTITSERGVDEAKSWVEHNAK
jgi:hypothetical protein